MISALGLTLALAAAGPDEQPVRVEVLASPTLGMESGVRMVHGLSEVLFLYDESLARRVDLDEGTAQRRAMGIAGRSLKMLLVDGPLELFLGTVEHEVFGHGARAREQGRWPGYELTIPLPYRLIVSPSQSFNGATNVSPTGFADADLPVASAGIEANVYSGYFQSLEVLRRGGLTQYWESMHYFGGWATYFGRWVDPTILGKANASGDLDWYAQLLAQRYDRFGATAERELNQRLRVAYFASFADPMLWLSAYQLFVEYLGRGHRWSNVPQWHVGGAALFLLTRFGLTPFGAEHTLDVTISSRALTLDVSGRFTSTGLAPAWGIGARLFRWTPRPGLELGASLDGWIQPELLPNWRNAFDGRILPGLSGMAEATWFPIEGLGLVVQLGAKSRGYVMSQPLESGLFVFAGVTLSTRR